MTSIRLDKYITDCTDMSRKEAKACIRKGRIIVDGEPGEKPGQKVCPENQVICLDGEMLHYVGNVYFMLYKPAGVVSATKDNRDTTVVDLIKGRTKELFPVGRLDKDTEGLCLLTNDGLLAHELLSPKKHVEKQYYVQLDKGLSAEDVAAFQSGIDIGEKYLTKPASLEIISETKAYVTICEGKYHQIKRMFAKMGKKVLYLKRIRMGSLVLDDSLKPGEYRELKSEEIMELWQRKNITL